MLEVGSVIAGKLRVDRILGQGGMGIVAAATHTGLDQRVAVKVMREQLANDPSTVERFLREARAAARLRSEHVCRVTDVGQLPSGAPYIVMELLDGSDLAALLATRPLSTETAVDYVLQACIAIGEAHAQGIVHRDLKPANLFLTKQVGGAPLIKVLDFGIAKAPGAGNVTLTQTEAMMGSPGYMSPEQLRSARDVDARTDIWALGVIVYQLVSGRLPFPATSVTELAVKVAMDPPDPLEGEAAFTAVVMRCLEKAPADRYPSIVALATALAPFGSDSARRSLAVIEQLAPRPATDALAATMAPVDVMARTAASVTPAPPPTTTLQGATGVAEVSPVTRTPRRPVAWIAGIAGAAVAGGVVAAIALARSDGEPRPAPAPAPIGTATAATPPAPAGSAADPARRAELEARFAKAIERQRCSEATELSSELITGGADMSSNAIVAACIKRRLEAMAAPSAPGAAATLLATAEEMFEADQHMQARGVVDSVLSTKQETQPARYLGLKIACKEGTTAHARRYLTGMTSGALRDEAVAFCRDLGVQLDEIVTKAKAKPARAPIPDDWSTELGMMMMQGKYKQSRDYVLNVLATYPDNMHARYMLTSAYCMLEDAANARSSATKLDDAMRAKAQRFACDGVDIDLSAK